MTGDPHVEPTGPSRRVRPLRDAVAFTLVLLTTAGVSGAILYQRMVSAYVKQVRGCLVRVAEAAASQIDADQHRRFTDPGQTDSPEYLAAVEPMRAMLGTVDGLRFLYTCVLIDGQVHFILDGTLPGDADGDGVEDHSPIMELYEDPDPQMLQALLEQRGHSTDRPYEDRWGWLMSGYAPLRDSAGRFVGIVGVDMTAERYGQELASMRLAGLWSALAALTVSVAVGVMVFRHQRFARQTEARRRRAEARLRHDALTDRLTGLPNRAALSQRLTALIARARREPGFRFAVLFLDFDRFKLINDSLGHDVGDELLREMAVRLRDQVGRVAAGPFKAQLMAARLGGDEFVVVLQDVKDVQAARALAESLQRRLGGPIRLGSHEVFSSVSIGLVLSDAGYTRAEDLLRDADIAMYRAKDAGRNQHALFDHTMHEQVAARMHLEADLRKAVERDELELFYQPIMALDTGRLAGFEALVRWRHPARGLIMPGEFITLAEETGLIGPIGWWVMQAATRQLAQWHAKMPTAARPDGLPPLNVSINLSKGQLFEPDLVPRVKQLLDDTGLPPSAVKLEVTESFIVERIQSVTDILDQLKALGLSLWMDDFGTGLSSMSGLREYPIDGLKIDRAFVKVLGEQREHAAVVHAIISLAHNLGMTVVAEGIETPDQLVQLQALECDAGQGYLFAKPMPADEAERFIYDTHLKTRRTGSGQNV